VRQQRKSALTGRGDTSLLTLVPSGTGADDGSDSYGETGT
jgi:hypothetical protein